MRPDIERAGHPIFPVGSEHSEIATCFAQHRGDPERGRRVVLADEDELIRYVAERVFRPRDPPFTH